MTDGHGELRARLRDAAASYDPDRARILARLERGRAGPHDVGRSGARRPAAGWLRVVAATAAVAGVLALGGYAVASAVRGDGGADGTVAAPPAPDLPARGTARGGAPGSPDPAKSSHPAPRSNPPSSAATGPAGPAATPPAAGTGSEDGPLRSDGSVDPHSNDYWAQSEVTLRTEERLTALTVVLRVGQTGSVTPAGAWRSAPEEDFTLDVAERDGFLVYTWVLRPGRTVRPGEWVFAGQYDHDRGGRDAGGDRYWAGARAGGEQLGVAGDFTP
ncbi:hypothetical protein AB0F07_25895 [Streptomyces fructofermentans]|uniref:hypothetical protein n=1 Tax=Streptomyces fructofermentans TaxID=152141 RepID=UPI0034100011